MKKIYLFLILCVFSISALLAQEFSDDAQILQLCIDLHEIQDLYPKFEDESNAPVYIMQYPIVIPTDLPLQKFDKRPVYRNRHEIYDNNVDAYSLISDLL